MRQARVSGACVVVLLFGALAAAPGGRSDAGAIKVEVVPEKVSLEAETSQHVLVIARNSGADARAVKLSWLAAPQITVTPSKSPNGRPVQLSLRRLAKGADVVWQFTVSAKPAARAQKLFFRVDYASGGDSKVATAGLDVENAAPEKVEDVASVEVKTTLESLDRNNPGVVYLIVTNKLATPLTVDRVDASGPESVDFSGPKKPVTIGARQSTALEVDVDAKERVRPGKHLLLFDLHLSWDDKRQARVITTQQAQIGVAGESAILTLLGVPTFLLLPGFLIMLAIATWWRFGVLRPGGAPAEAPFEFTKPDFWALAITASIVIAVVYPLVGGADYLRGAYGLTDIVIIWVASLVIGTVIWFTIMGTRWIRHWLRTPTQDDDPRSTLRRLGRQGLALTRPRYAFGAGPNTYTGFVLQRDRNAPKVWLAPRITVSVKPNAEGGNVLLNELADENDPKQLAKKLKSRRRDLNIVWEHGGGPEGPYERTAAELGAAQQQSAERIVRTS